MFTEHHSILADQKYFKDRGLRIAQKVTELLSKNGTIRPVILPACKVLDGTYTEDEIFSGLAKYREDIDTDYPIAEGFLEYFEAKSYLDLPDSPKIENFSPDTTFHSYSELTPEEIKSLKGAVVLRAARIDFRPITSSAQA